MAPALQPAVGVRIVKDGAKRVEIDAQRGAGAGEIDPRFALQSGDNVDFVDACQLERLLQFLTRDDRDACARRFAPNARKERNEAQRNVAHSAIPVEQEGVAPLVPRPGECVVECRAKCTIGEPTRDALQAGHGLSC